MTTTVRHVETDDGASIHYHVHGEGPPLVFLMGFGLDHQGWWMQTPRFRRQFRCVLIDNRGVGRSTLGWEPVSMARMAADVIAVLDQEGIDRAHVVAISMGGMMALHLALNAPERIDRLVLCATTAGLGNHGPLVSEQIMRAMGFDDGETARITSGEAGFDARFNRLEFARLMGSFVFSESFLASSGPMLSQIMGMFVERFAKNEVLHAQYVAILGHEVHARLGDIRVPTLVYVGDADRLVPPEHSHALVTGIPGARLLEMRDGSHAYNVERGSEFNETVIGFLTEAAVRT